MAKKEVQKSEAWYPPSWELSDASAIQALERGDATKEQQQRALKWIIENASLTYDLSYRPESERDTTFAEGRRFVGLNIVKLLKLNLSLLRRKENA